MSNDIAKVDGLDAITRGLAVFGGLGPQQSLPKHLRNPADCAILAAVGEAIGINPVLAVMQCHLVDGRLVLPAEMMAARVMASPVCEWWVLVESTDRIATIETLRRGSPRPTRMSYTIEQAARAGLAGHGTWQKHPEAMLRARCTSALARAVYPDVIAGAYVEDEGAEIRGEYREQPAPTGRVYDIREAEPVRVDGLEHPALALESEPFAEPPEPRAWWDRWRAACAGLPFADALAILRGAGIDTDSEPAVRDRWPSAEEAARKAARCSQPSRSRDGQGYELQRKPDGAWRCNCEAGAFGRPCIHAKAAEVAFWRRLMPGKAWATIAAVCGDVPADDRLDEAMALVASWREMILEGDA